MPIAEEDLTFAALEDMDNGVLLKLLKKHLANVAADCAVRPGDKASRKVTLEFIFKPVPRTIQLEGGGTQTECDRVDLEIECKSKVPVYRSATIQCRPHRTGFIFNRDFPGNILQPSLYGDDEGDE